MTDLEAVIAAAEEAIGEATAYLNGAPDSEGRMIPDGAGFPLIFAIGVLQTFRDKLVAAQAEIMSR